MTYRTLVFVACTLVFAVGCGEPTADDRDIFESPDGGLGPSIVGSKPGSNSSNSSTPGTFDDCESEFGELECLGIEHLQLGFETRIELDDATGTEQSSRSLYACGASPVAEQPVDERFELGRDESCVAYRGIAKTPYAPKVLDAGPINLFSNELVAALVGEGPCYVAQNPVDNRFFEGELVSIDVSGGDDVAPYVGDVSWMPAPVVGPRNIAPGEPFSITWEAAENDAQVFTKLDFVDTEGVGTTVQCVTGDDGSVELTTGVTEFIPEESISATLTVTRRQLEVVGSSPALVIVREATSEVALDL